MREVISINGELALSSVYPSSCCLAQRVASPHRPPSPREGGPLLWCVEDVLTLPF